jgi:filamentous hemagglutinin
MTLAAISGVAGNTAARTGDAETGIKPIFDQTKVQKEIDAQVKITQMFGQLAPKAAADFAKTRHDDLLAQAKLENDPAKKTELVREAKLWDEGGAYRIALHTAIGGLAGGASGALGAGATAAAAPLLNELQDNIAKGLKDAGASDGIAKVAGQLIAGTTAAGIGAVVGGAGGAMTGFNVDANNRQLHPTEAKIIKENAAKYATRRGIGIEQAEAELTQQAMQQTDSAWDERLGTDNKQAQAFLNEIGTGANLTDLLTGQKFQLFTADQTARENHAIFAQYVKTSPAVQHELDLAMSKAYLPKDAQTLDQRGMSGSDMALNDAARDFGNMKSQPATVQWAVLGELRQTRQQNQQAVAQLEQERASLPLSPENTQRRGELQAQIDTLAQRDQALLGSIKSQLLDMGSAGSGLLIPGKYREWTEGFGEARAMAGLNFKGVGQAGIGARVDVIKGAIQEVKAVTEAEKAAQRAVESARIEGNIRRDDGQQYERNNAPINVPETVTRRDNDFAATVNYKGKPKAHTDADGNLIAANPEGTGSVQSHVLGTNPKNTPYISTTDPELTSTPKNYGDNQISVNSRDLQRDINAGRVSQDVEIVPPAKLQAELQSKIDAAQVRYDGNPSPANKESLDRANQALGFAVRDGECLVKGCIPAPYIQWPNGRPQVPPVTAGSSVDKAR